MYIHISSDQTTGLQAAKIIASVVDECEWCNRVCTSASILAYSWGPLTIWFNGHSEAHASTDPSTWSVDQASLLTMRESAQKAALNYLVCLADPNGKDGWGGGERSHRAVGGTHLVKDALKDSEILVDVDLIC